MPEGNEQKLPDLSAALREALIKKAGSISRAATELSLSDNSLRVWLKRDKYPPAELRAILRFVGLKDDLQEISKQFGFKTTNPKRAPIYSKRERTQNIATLDRALTVMAERFEQFRRMNPEFGEDVKLLFGSMKRNDVFMLLSLDELPFEMTQLGWQQSGALVAKAVEEEAYFCYLHPSDAVIEYLRERQQTDILTPSEFRIKFDKFRNNVRALILDPEKATDTYLDAHLIHLECPMSSFLAAGHKYVLFKPRDGQVRALAKFPTGTLDREFPLHLLLDRRTTNEFASLVLAITEKSVSRTAVADLLNASNAVGR